MRLADRQRVKGRLGRGAVFVVAGLVVFALLTAPAFAAAENYADDFDPSTGFSGDDGSLSWDTNWIESEADGPSAGAIQATSDGRCTSGECLMIGRGANDASVERELDLNGVGSATLTFDYEIHKHDAGAGSVTLEASATGSAPWTTLKTYSLGADTGQLSESVSLLPHADEDMRIRFVLTGGSDDSHLNVDNVNVAVTKNSAPVLDPVGDQSVDELATLAFTATATDEPGQSLTFSLSGEPAGASITSGGDFTWTPTEAQGPGSYTFDVVVTDNGTPALSDTETITVTVAELNVAPSLTDTGPDPKIVEEGTLFDFSAVAEDEDLPANNLAFSLSGEPAGASITAGGDFTWTPSEAQGPGVYVFDIVVTDDGTPNLSDSATITITVTEGNSAPVLNPVGDQTVDELTNLAFTATASDPDSPPNNLTFSLSGSVPSGASITAAGDFTWTPTEAQGPGSYTFDVVVTDDGTGNLSDSETITITVNEVNLPPVLAAVGDRSIDEGKKLAFTASASDPDDPANALAFSLSGAPSGASITAGGAFTWTPTEAQGPGSYTFDIVVTDDGSPAKSAKETITVKVTEVNQPPLLDPIADQTVDEGKKVTFTAKATDPDTPANSLTFSLSGTMPSGASITTGGVFTWMPTEAQGPGTYTFDVVVTDDGSPAKTAKRTVTITVNEVNVAPNLEPIGDKSVDEGSKLTFTVSATDPDIPANGLTFSLGGAPVGAKIDGKGTFTWTPTEAQGPGSYTFDIVVTDGGTPAKSASRTLTVTVNEVNAPPKLSDVSDSAVTVGDAVVFTAKATDPDLPANGLRFSMSGAPAGASIDAVSGDFTWTTSEVGTYTFDITVTDDGTPAKKNTVTITITVERPNRAPTVDSSGNQSSLEGDEVSLRITASDPDGDELTFTASGLPPGVTIDRATGRIRGTLPFTASEGSAYAVVVTVTDDGSPAKSTSISFRWSVADVNRLPTGEDATHSTDEDTPITFTLAGSDPDDDPLGFVLRRRPGVGTASLGGNRLTFTPPHDWSGTTSLTYVVSDGRGESEEHTVVIIVNEVNDLPTGNDDAYETDYGDTLEVPGSGVLGNDSDPEGQALRAQLASAPANGTVEVRPDGSFTYTPDEGFSGTDTFSYRIVDASGATDTASVVIEVGPAPQSSAVRDSVVSSVLTSQADDAFEPTAVESDQPAVRRTLVFMGQATRASVEEMGIPLIMLIGLFGLALSAGRISLVPLGSKRSHHEGTVRMYDSEAGFGLVLRDEDSAEVFVHTTAVRPRRMQLHAGDRVRFTSITGTHRDMITKLRKIKAERTPGAQSAS